MFMESNTFSDKLKFGQVAEGAISKFLIKKGCSVIPVYEKEINTGKGPQVYNANGSFVAPDALVYNAGKFFFAECKRKTAFTWYRKLSVFETGIDKKHYEHYLEVSKIFNIEVWLFFLHMGGIAKDSPPSPSGLYTEKLSYLSNNISHETDKYANGMVYWAEQSLRRIADVKDLDI